MERSSCQNSVKCPLRMVVFLNQICVGLTVIYMYMYFYCLGRNTCMCVEYKGNELK